MENRKDYEKRLGERLEAAYMQEDIGPAMSREEFHRLIQTAEKKKKHRRTMLSLAAACVALCLVCGGFVAGMTMRESASAGKDDETKTVQQGSSVVIGSGVSENDQNVGVSKDTFYNLEDIPDDLAKKIVFLQGDEFMLKKVNVVKEREETIFELYYLTAEEKSIEITEETMDFDKKNLIIPSEKHYYYKGNDISYEVFDEGKMYYFYNNNIFYSVLINEDDIKIETVLNGLVY